MDLRIRHLNCTPPPAPTKRTAESASSAPFSLSFPREDTAGINGIPAMPPSDALREVDLAAARADELWRDKRELHFAIDEESGRVTVQVRDLEGRVVRMIPPSEALDVLSGRPL
jgi:flagellar protein FlaG